jgi:hypothetical protein
MKQILRAGVGHHAVYGPRALAECEAEGWSLVEVWVADDEYVTFIFVR